MKIDYENLKHHDRLRRSYNYKKLRNVGFNSYDANKFKDYSNEKIIDLIAEKEFHNSNLKQIAGGSNG